MKKALILFSAVLTLTWVSSAQDAKSASPNPTSVTGCLAGAAGSYTLTDQAGKSYMLSGKTEDLAQHVGHKVEVTGLSPSPAESSTSPTNSVSFEVASAKMISEQCAAGAAAGSHDNKSVAVGAWDKGTTGTPGTDASAGSVNQTPATAEAATSTNTMNQAEATTAASSSAAAGEDATAASTPATRASAAESADAASPPAEDTTAVDKTGSISASNNDAALPQTASSLPLFGLLAVGFLCAGYMILRTD